MIIPCKECLVLVRCKQKATIECYRLYEWVKVNNDTSVDKLAELSMNVEIVYKEIPRDPYAYRDTMIRGENPYINYIEIVSNPSKIKEVMKEE